MDGRLTNILARIDALETSGNHLVEAMRANPDHDPALIQAMESQLMVDRELKSSLASFDSAPSREALSRINVLRAQASALRTDMKERLDDE